jgi:hypothetical protein
LRPATHVPVNPVVGPDPVPTMELDSDPGPTVTALLLRDHRPHALVLKEGGEEAL